MELLLLQGPVRSFLQYTFQGAIDAHVSRKSPALLIKCGPSHETT